MLIRKIWR